MYVSIALSPLVIWRKQSISKHKLPKRGFIKKGKGTDAMKGVDRWMIRGEHWCQGWREGGWSAVWAKEQQNKTFFL